MTNEKISMFINKNKWIIFISLIFIVWKFFLVSVFFNHEFSKSEEAEIYIYHINSINKCRGLIFCNEFLSSFEAYFGFEHLSYRLFFGSIGHLLNMSSSNVFHLSFYIGILFLLPVLIIFLKNIETDKNLIAFLLFFLLLYNGGRYHGFWWVVPGFFAMLFIFLIFAVLMGNNKHWKIILLILIPIGFYMHMIFLYMMATLVLFYGFYSFFTKNLDKVMLKKIIFSLVLLPILYFPISYYLNKDNKDNPYGLGKFIVNSKLVSTIGQSLRINNFTNNSFNTSIPINKQNLPQDKRIFPGFRIIKDFYFDWVLFNPFLLAVFIYIIFVITYYRQYKILSLYCAALTFTLISSINQHADRSLVFIWPITFLLYGYGVWFSFKLIEEKIKNSIVSLSAKICLYSGLIFFTALNLLYSYGINTNLLFSLQQYLNNYVRNYW